MDNLNPEKFIPEWNDPERINFLYSAFPADKNVNEHHYESKLNYWKKTVASIVCSDAYKRSYFNWNELSNFVKKENRQPLGMDTVFDEMLAAGDIVPLKAYMHDLEVNGTWTGWGINQVLKKPSKWMLNKVLSPLKRRNTEQKFVFPEAVTTKGHLLLNKVHKMHSSGNFDDHHYANMNIFELSDLLSATTEIFDGHESLEIVLAQLKFQGKVVVHIQEDEKCRKYIKFADKNESKVDPINEINIGCIQLHQTKEHLESSIHSIYTQIDELVAEAKQLSKDKKKGLALNALRKKQRLLGTIEKKEIALSNTEKLLDSISQCKNDKLVMETYKTGVKAFQELMNQEGMSLDEVEKTKADLEDVFDLHDEMSNIVSAPINGVEEDDSLEMELNSLLESKETNNELEEALEALKISEHKNDTDTSLPEDLLNLPDVPESCLVNETTTNKLKPDKIISEAIPTPVL